MQPARESWCATWVRATVHRPSVNGSPRPNVCHPTRWCTSAAPPSASPEVPTRAHAPPPRSATVASRWSARRANDCPTRPSSRRRRSRVAAAPATRSTWQPSSCRSRWPSSWPSSSTRASRSLGLAGPVVTIANHVTRRRRTRRDQVRHEIGTRAALNRFRHDLAAARPRTCGGCGRRHPISARSRRASTTITPDSGSGAAATTISRSRSEPAPLRGNRCRASTERDLDHAARALPTSTARSTTRRSSIDARHPIGIRGDTGRSAGRSPARCYCKPRRCTARPICASSSRPPKRGADEWEWTAWLPHTHDHARRRPTGRRATRRRSARHRRAVARRRDGDESTPSSSSTTPSLVANRATPVRHLLAGSARHHGDRDRVALGPVAVAVPHGRRRRARHGRHRRGAGTSTVVRDVRGAGISATTAAPAGRAHGALRRSRGIGRAAIAARASDAAATPCATVATAAITARWAASRMATRSWCRSASTATAR